MRDRHLLPAIATHRSGLTRRQTLQWLGALSASAALPVISGCESIAVATARLAGNWPDLKLEPITGPGYGTDPDLVTPPRNPWPLTMTAGERDLTAVLCDILIPREGDVPSASEVGVPDLIDEWISAPYPGFQSDRVEILSALAWTDQESERRFGRRFVEADTDRQLQIIDDIAFEEAEKDIRYVYIARVFDGIRTLVTVAFFSSPAGSRDLGYLGNVPIAGDYPGPSPEATEHLAQALAALGLSEHAY